MYAILKNEYKYNTEFKKYVDKYCTENECTVEEALKKENVRQMFFMYTDL